MATVMATAIRIVPARNRLARGDLAVPEEDGAEKADKEDLMTRRTWRERASPPDDDRDLYTSRRSQANAPPNRPSEPKSTVYDLPPSGALVKEREN